MELSQGTKNAALLIQTVYDFIREEGIYDSNDDSPGFYDTDEWKERGEIYGLSSELIMTYDGSIMYYIMNPGYSSNPKWAFGAFERFADKLAKIGFWIEPCTGWYAAFYPFD